MSYTVLARRYRSRDFDEVVGQEPISRTLSNAIAANRTAHAYLFCGTRGVGKTSLARIFAKALNVSPDLQESEAIADAVLRGDDLDVIEIDGASNRGIQEAKDLIAGAGLSPARSPYKIYIIDEVHALTRDAFNALLKTMEEPPAHVKFILCTTDPMKVPATIQSRCQRFDFRPISTALIAEHLRQILKREGIEAEDALVVQIARLGAGSMRDALSLLDRIISSGEKNLTLAEAERVLGLPDHTLVVGLVNAIVEGDAGAALHAGADLLDHGASVEQAMEMLTEYLRVLMVTSACGANTELLDVAEDIAAAATEQAARFDLPRLVYLIALCDSVARNARGATTARAVFDAAIVRMCMSDQLAEIADLVAGASSGSSAGAARSTTRRVEGKKKGELNTKPVRRDPAPARTPPRSEPAAQPTTPDAAPARETSSTFVESKPITDEGLWPTVVTVARESARDQAKVQHLAFRSFDGETLRLVVSESGRQKARFLKTQKPSIQELVERATARRVKVIIDVPVEASAASAPAPSSGADSSGATPDATSAGRAAGTTPGTTAREALEETQRHPAVRRAMEIFGAVVTDVSPITAATPAAPVVPGTPETLQNPDTESRQDSHHDQEGEATKDV